MAKKEKKVEPLVKVIALKAKKGKPQHMEEGKVYEVSKETAAAMFKNGTAEAAKADQEVGKVYTSKKGKAGKEDSGKEDGGGESLI